LGALTASGDDEPKFEFERTVLEFPLVGSIDRPITCESSNAATIGIYVPLGANQVTETATISSQTKPSHECKRQAPDVQPGGSLREQPLFVSYLTPSLDRRIR
jgi:hypothetical protein